MVTVFFPGNEGVSNDPRINKSQQKLFIYSKILDVFSILSAPLWFPFSGSQNKKKF